MFYNNKIPLRSQPEGNFLYGVLILLSPFLLFLLILEDQTHTHIQLPGSQSVNLRE